MSAAVRSADKDADGAVHAAVSGAASSSRHLGEGGRGAARIVPDAVADRDEIGAGGDERADLVERRGKCRRRES